MKFLRHLFLDDFLLKLFSFVLALLFWLTVSFAIQQKEGPAQALSLTSEPRTMILRLPVRTWAPTAATIVKFTPPEVEVTVQGDAQLLHDLPTRELRALVDLGNVDPARNPTGRVDVTIPAGVTCVRVDPAEVRMQIVPPAKN